jgi:hypothetical protein
VYSFVPEIKYSNRKSKTMKKQLSILLAICLAGATMNGVKAQTHSLAGFDAGFQPAKVQPQIIHSEPDLLTNIQKKFHKEFANVTFESWTKTNDGYAIRFFAGAIYNLVFYNTNAKLTEQVRYYKRNYLPIDIRYQVESTYHNYNIVSVQEITVEKSITYLVSIEMGNEWKIVRVNETGMDVYKEYRKG